MGAATHIGSYLNMPLIVQKYGGTSVADTKHIKLVANKIASFKRAGSSVIVVVSAMGGVTDKLEMLAQSISDNPDRREFDVLLSTGEQVTIALVTMALLELGLAAKSFIGTDLIVTDDKHSRARIVEIKTEKVQKELDKGTIVVVAGFQGADKVGNITTLGRGGSDITAVALAQAFQAEECHIYTDVDGVYTADPRLVINARKIDNIDYAAMLEFASLGAKVVQIRAVELAARYRIRLRVLSTFKNSSGTLICEQEGRTELMEQYEVVGVTHAKGQVKVNILNLPLRSVGKLLTILTTKGIEIDMLTSLHVRMESCDLSFTLGEADCRIFGTFIRNTAEGLGSSEILLSPQKAKLSLVGVGMGSCLGISGKMLTVLEDQGIVIESISSSEVKVSVLVDEKYLEHGVLALHEAFHLGDSLKLGLALQETSIA